MHIRRVIQGSAILLLTIPVLATTHSRRSATSGRLVNRHTARSIAKPSSQRAIDDARATQIQTALIHAGYLSGDASGRWDSSTEAAMQKFQGDNGWQTKLIPDSRAIIKLGLGPNSDAEESRVEGAASGIGYPR